MEVDYSVLENGLDFILMAVNDLAIIDENAPDDEANKRLIKYSLLHLSSGIELVFKYRLLLEHWTYVFADMNKAKKEALQSGEFESANSKTIIERMKNLCDIELKPDEVLDLENLRKRRNKVEHFRLNENILSIKSSIHKSITILIKMILAHYDTDKFTDEENTLLSQIKSLLQQSKQHYDDALAIAQRELEQSSLENEAVSCPKCEEEFLIIDDGVKCIFCGYEATGEDAAREYISNILGISEYEIIKDGGELPLYECPECEDECLVFDEANYVAICFSCGYNENLSNLSLCEECGKPYLLTDYEVTICPACIDDKFDEED